MNLPTSLSCLKSLKTARVRILKHYDRTSRLYRRLSAESSSRLRDKSKTVPGVTLFSLFLLCLPSNYCPIVPPLFVSLLVYSHHTHSSGKDFGCVFLVCCLPEALPGSLPHCGDLAHSPFLRQSDAFQATQQQCPPNNPRSPALLLSSPLHLLPSCLLSLLLIYCFMSFSVHKTRNPLGRLLLFPRKPPLTQNCV